MTGKKWSLIDNPERSLHELTVRDFNKHLSQGVPFKGLESIAHGLCQELMQSLTIPDEENPFIEPWDDAIQLLWLTRARSICQVLLRAAGLPDEKDPISDHLDFASMTVLEFTVGLIMFQSYGRTWPNPRIVEDKLEAIRRDIKKIERRIKSLDDGTQSKINRAGDPQQIEIEAAKLSGDFSRILHASKATVVEPYEQWTIPAARSALARLDAGIKRTIEQTIEAGEHLPATGRIPNYSARTVACRVAEYLRDATGKTPTLWKGDEPSGPFALALREIFKILDIKAGVQRPGEYAISKLSENPEF